MTQILNTKKLIELYKLGYFPMAENSNADKINLYKPNKRFIIPINTFHIPKKLLSEFKKNKFTFKINSDFKSTINNCSLPRYEKDGTWINSIIKNTYIKLNEEGYAKSIECIYKKEVVGGLYGIHINACFFGESMFSKISNTSKLSLLYLISILKSNKFLLLDSQFFNKHLLQFGALEISNTKYQILLKKGLKKKAFFPKEFDAQKSFSILQLLSHKS